MTVSTDNHHVILYRQNTPGRTGEHARLDTRVVQLCNDRETLDLLISSYRHMPIPEIPGLTNMEYVAEGGAGVIYRGYQQNLNRFVAVKILCSERWNYATAIARFQAEATAMANLLHTNITQIYEFGSYQGKPYLLMEYVEGGSLAELLLRGPISTSEAVRIIHTVSLAVQNAHDHAILHRDLKPDNILLTKEGMPKVTDFGMARLIDDDTRLTQTGFVVGTPQYTAPELLQGLDNFTTTVDVYSLGVILYEMLTGRLPYEGSKPAEIILEVMQKDPTPPRKLRPSIPVDLETICLKCMSKQPDHRYPSAAALAEDLLRYQRRLPIAARPTDALKRSWMWCCRQPIAAALLVMAVVVLLLGFAGSIYMSRTLSTQNQKLSASHEAELTTRRLAEHHLQLTRRTLRNLVRSASENQYLLVENPEMYSQLLDSTAQMYMELANKQGPHFNYEMERAQTWAELALVYDLMGQTSQAIQAEMQARTIYEVLMANSYDSNLRFELARTLCHLGALFRETTELTKAEQHFRQALTFLTDLTTNGPILPEWELELGKMQLNLGRIHHDRGDVQGASDHFHQAIHALRSYAQDDVVAVEKQYYLGEAHFQLGRLRMSQANWLDAEVALKNALHHFQQLAATFPHRPDFRKQYACSLATISQVEEKQTRFAQAQRTNREAMSVMERLVAQYPRVPVYQEHLAQYKAHLVVLEKQHRPE